MVDKEISELREIVEDHEERISKLESLFQTKPEVVKKKASIQEFILSKKPKNDVQKLLSISYYLEKYEGISSFNVRDLENNFRAAKEKVPKNVGDIVQKNIKKGYMMKAEEKKDDLKAWLLTNSGEKHVENEFKRER